jgi:hypothetical protein
MMAPGLANHSWARAFLLSAGRASGYWMKTIALGLKADARRTPAS